MNQLSTWMSANSETDDSLAAKAEVSRVQINRLRRGVNRPRQDLALRLSSITGIPAGDLIMGLEATTSAEAT